MNKDKTQNKNNSFVGVDISKDKIDVCLLLNDDTSHKLYKNSEEGFKELEKYLSNKKVRPHICMEATGKCHLGVATYMNSKGYKVSVVNPFKIKSFRSTKLLRNKTDSYDAYAIAEYCELYEPREWHADSKEKAELKDLYRALESYKSELTRERNKLDEEYIRNKKLVKIKKETISHIEEQIKKVEEFISNNEDMKAKCEILKTIPGIANTTAVALLAELPEINNYKTARELVAHIGVTPCHNISGKSIYKKSSISKIGSGVLRKILCFPSIVESVRNESLSDFAAKLKTKGKAKMSAIIAVMRKLVHIIYGVLKSGERYKENYTLNLTKQEYYYD